MTQRYLDLAGVEFPDEAERAAARAFAHVPRAKGSGNTGLNRVLADNREAD